MARQKYCLECGAALAAAGAGPRKGRTAEFCSTKHRMDWNNRRQQRGAVLYDLYMAHRYDRETATELNVFSLMNRLASTFREADIQERASRRTWRDPKTVISERPYLKADILQRAAKPVAAKQGTAS